MTLEYTVDYVLSEEGVKDVIFQRMSEARLEAEARALSGNHPMEGWRQEEPNVWFLLPGKRFRIELRSYK
jgi:hypothetical protein